MTAKQKLFAIHELTEHASTDPTPEATLLKIHTIYHEPGTTTVPIETPVMRMVAKPVPTGAPAALDQHFQEGLALKTVFPEIATATKPVQEQYVPASIAQPN